MLFLTSIWLGILTSISPCPLATNIAAISYVGKNFKNPQYVLLNGLVYTFGRCLFYIALGIILFQMLKTIPTVSYFLQNQMGILIAPFMIILGILMLDILSIKLPVVNAGKKSYGKITDWGMLGSFIIGVIFAMTFCPISAALFFSNLINSKGNIIALILYGIGTGLPVVVVSVVLAFSINKIGIFYKITTSIEKYARLLTATLFIVIGIYYIWRSL